MLTFDHVSKQFGSLKAIKDITLSFEPGLIYSLIGPNGAGKSTLVNLAAGSYRPTSGAIWLNKQDLSVLKKHKIFQAGLARTYQNIRLFENMTVIENLEVVLYREQISSLLLELLSPPHRARLKEERVSRGREALRLVGMSALEDDLAGDLPYGLQKKLEIARALVGRPTVLLLDEPAAGLNHTESLELRDLLKQLKAPDRVVVVIEHDMELVMSMSDRIHVLYHGDLLFSGRPDEVVESEAVQEAYLGRSDDLTELHDAFEARRRHRGLREGGRPQERFA